MKAIISGNNMENKTIEIANIVFKILLEKKFTIGFCESCTGGLISGTFSRIPGASLVLDRSIVTYSNNSKIEEVNVKSETLEKYGAVSEEVALEMAQGMLSHGDLNIALSVTGIAGPPSKHDTKPVGLVYVCIITKDKHKIIKLNLLGDRIEIQNQVVQQAFAEIRNFLME